MIFFACNSQTQTASYFIHINLYAIKQGNDTEDNKNDVNIRRREEKREREREKERSTREAITVPSFLPTRVGSDWAICKRGGFIG